MKKIKHWKYILFPCLSLVAISCVVIPAACIAARPRFHMNYKGTRWGSIEQAGQTTLDYTFYLYEPIDLSNQYIDIDIEMVKFLDVNSYPKLEGEIKFEENKKEFHQTVGLYRKDGKPLEPNDCTSFNFYIKLKRTKDNKTIWSDSILNLQLQYSPKE